MTTRVDRHQQGLATITLRQTAYRYPSRSHGTRALNYFAEDDTRKTAAQSLLQHILV